MSEKQTRPGPRIDLTSTHSSRKESKVAFVQCCCSPVSTGTTYDYSIVHLDESLKPFIRVTHTQAQGPPVCSTTWKYQQRLWTILCNLWLQKKQNNFCSFQQKHDGDQTFPHAVKMLFRLHSTGNPGGCLSTQGLSLWEHMKECYRGKGGLDNK